MTKSVFPKVLLLLAMIACVFGCGQKASRIAHAPFHARISAFTSGLIQSGGSVVVEFADSVPGSMPGSEANADLFKISPRLKGNWSWIDHRSVKFSPSQKLPPDHRWEVTVFLQKIFPGEPEDFYFNFGTLPQNYRVITDPLTTAGTDDYANYMLAGKIELADDATTEAVEAMLEATLKGKRIPITWNHKAGKTHPFEIGPLPRSDKKEVLTLAHTGDPVDVDQKAEVAIPIPALNEFSVQSVEVVQNPRQVVRITFSDPLQTNQDLAGLVVVKDLGDSPYLLKQNILELFPGNHLSGDQVLTIFPGILNTRGQALRETQTHNIHFSSMDPAVEIVGQGNIMPFSDGLMLHFKAVSLKGVVVRIIKIYENNIPYFLQVNTLDEDSQLKRAGRLVHQSVISFDTDATLDLNQWNSFALELSKFIQPDPGAIYRVELGFDQSLSAYPCAGLDSVDAAATGYADSFEDGDFWDDPENYYNSYPYYYDEDWNWEERDDPCSASYYSRSRWVARNLLASNLGIIAKGGTAGTYQAYVTDLRNTEPLGDVSVELLDFQMQPLATGKTNSEGSVVLTTKGKPFLLIAKKEKQKGYLRLDDGRMLPLSRFDVSGQAVPKGIKGYIYGERGVWRPGDSIFISFIPEDRYQKLPANHPIIFELVNPRGQLVARQVARHPENRIYTFRTCTRENDLTGFWLARVLVGDALFEQTIRIETIKPNRLKINLTFGQEKLEGSKPISGQLSSEWLHGAVAANLKAQVRLTMKPIKTTFKNFPDFNFDNAAIEFETAEETVFESTLNAKGMASFNFQPIFQQKAPGMLKASFTTRIFEEGGSFSIDRFEVPLSPFKRYVGLRAPKGDKNGLLLTDTNHEIEVVTVNSQGEPVSVSGLTYAVYKVNWRWWWERSEDENLGAFVSSNSTNLIASGSTRTINGKGSLVVRVDKPDWGRYLIQIQDPEGGHSTTATILIDWPGWAQKTDGSDADAATMLVFSADKERYKVGETAKISFPSASGGRALVSLENGTGMVQSFWVKTSNGSTEFSFEVTDEMKPNIYVQITLLQPHNQTANDLPIRLYGVIPLLVHSPESVLTPVVKAASEWSPQQNAVVEVSEKSGKPMSYTLAVVDEGLLSLTRFSTPNAWNHFNAREALGVKTWDLYDQVLGAYGGRIERMFSIGGSEELIGSQSDQKARRFEPMIRVLGPFDLKKNGTNKHQFSIPNYTGSVRVMVVAASSVASGSVEVTIPVRQALMVWAGLPRVAGPGETVMLPVTIFASGKALGNIQVTIQPSDHFKIIGSATQTLQLTGEGEKTIYFEMKAGNLTGLSRVEVLAQSGQEKASHEINLPVRNPNPPVTKVVTAIIPGGGKSNLAYQLPGAPGSNQALLEISAIPPMDFGRRLHDLLDYPHGCIEQITSGAFPQLFLPEMTDLNEASLARVRSNVQSVISRLSSYQTSQGGFSYWPGNSGDPADWATSYAGHFLLEAEKKGYAIPNQLKSSWLKNQKNAASAWLPDHSGHETGSDFIQAYRLFTLSLAGEADMSGMNRLRQQPTLSSQARWRLAAAYALSGMGEVARELVSAIPIETSDKTSYYQTYGSDERDMAMVLETQLLLGQKEEAARLALQIAKKLNSNHWMSTQTTAYCLLSMSRFSAGEKVASGPVMVRYQVNGTPAIQASFSVPYLQKELLLESMPDGTILIENRSQAQIFANLILKGQPLHDNTLDSESSGLVMRVEYVDLDNKPLSVTSIPQGTDVKSIVTIFNPGIMELENLALTQIFASGWEIRNTRFEESGAIHEIDMPDYRDIRDDRVYAYFGLKPGQTKRFVTVLHTSFAGKFFLPPVLCEAMYDYSIRAKTPGQWTSVNR